MFDDPNVLLMQDRVVEGEQRWHAIGAVSEALLLVVHTYREDDDNGEEIIRIISAREANQRERRIYIQQAARISGKRRSWLGIAKRQAAGDDSEIDYSDIPPLTDEQLAQFRRAPKVLVAARLDRDVYDWLKKVWRGLFDPHQQYPAHSDVQGAIASAGAVLFSRYKRPR